MPAFELTVDEKRVLLEILERSHHNLRLEIVNTDNREFRRELKQREILMQELIARLKTATS